MTRSYIKRERSRVIKHLWTWQLCSAFVPNRVDESQMSERIKNTHSLNSSSQYISNLFAISQWAVHHMVICQGSVWTAVIDGFEQDNLCVSLMTSYVEVTQRSWCFFIWHCWHEWTHDELCFESQWAVIGGHDWKAWYALKRSIKTIRFKVT